MTQTARQGGRVVGVALVIRFVMVVRVVLVLVSVLVVEAALMVTMMKAAQEVAVGRPWWVSSQLEQ